MRALCAKLKRCHTVLSAAMSVALSLHGIDMKTATNQLSHGVALTLLNMDYE